MRLGALFSRRVTWRVARVAPAFLESTPAPPRPEELTQLGHCGRGEGSGTWSMAPAPACLVLRGASATRVLSPAPASSPASGSAGQADALTGSASSHAPPSAATPDSADSPAIPVPRPVANLVFGRRVWNPRPRPARAILPRASTRRSPVAPPMLRARPTGAVIVESTAKGLQGGSVGARVPTVYIGGSDASPARASTLDTAVSMEKNAVP